MNRHDTHLVPSTRPASRRLHRRSAPSAVAPCVLGSSLAERTCAPVGRLPQALVREAGMFELLAAEMRIAELEKALAEAADVACTDPLTHALNRRGFDKACGRELARARRAGKQCALALIDLDDFKRLNDTQGHQVGDRALVHLVELLHRSMRPSDLLCRFGGEEFVLMLPDISLADASLVLSRFLSEFSARSIPGTDVVLTFSAGVVLQQANEALEDALRRADAATYAAKHAGKNCVVSH